MNNVVKTSNCIFKSGDYHYDSLNVNTLFGRLSSQNIRHRDQQITSAKYTVLIHVLRVRQNWRIIRAAKMFGCSGVSAHSLVRRFEQTGTGSTRRKKTTIR